MPQILDDFFADTFDSRDFIEEQEAWLAIAEDVDYSEEERAEARKNYHEYCDFCEELQGSPDWLHGETVIREEYFVDYIEELIKDCYELPKELTSGNWPWRHITIDYEAAAEEAKVDYIESKGYLVRA